MSDSLADLTVAALSSGYRARDFSPIEVLEAIAGRIEAVEGRVHALSATRLEAARAEAEAAGGVLRRGNAVRALEGIPFVVKDLLDAADLPATYGAPRIFAGHVPRTDADTVARLRRAGAILVAKTTTHQFGWGVTTPGTANPWDLRRVAGGSSGGSAVAVATGEAPLALGTDTAGSVRIPADFCGVVGFRPTSGTVSRAGVFPLAPTLDQVGTMARTPRDAALAYATLVGGALDPPGDGLRGARVATLDTVEPPTDRRRVLDAALAGLRDLGARQCDAVVSGAAGAHDTLATIVLAEGRLSHRERGLWPDRREHYAPDVRQRLERADRQPAGAYGVAMADRERLRDALARAFADVDLLVSLVSSASPIEQTSGGGDAAFRRAVMSPCAPPSLCGLPACAVPAGFDGDGLPVGIQITGRPGADLAVLAAAQALHEAGGAGPWRPPLLDRRTR